jgi:hypothetical protein
MTFKILNEPGIRQRVDRLKVLGKDIHPNFLNTVTQIALNQMIIEEFTKRPEFNKVCLRVARELLDAEIQQTSPIIPATIIPAPKKPSGGYVVE